MATMPAAMTDLSLKLTAMKCLRCEWFDNAFAGVVQDPAIGRIRGNVTARIEAPEHGSGA
jgi:hypothetical protein